MTKLISFLCSLIVAPIFAQYGSDYISKFKISSELYSDGQNNGPSYSEIAYSVEAGPGSVTVSYGEYENTGDNTLVGYDWNVGEFTLGFYYFDYEDDASVAGGPASDDGAYISISRSF